MMRLEWAYRLLQEPARLWRRYVIGIPVFLFHVLRYRFRRRERILSYPEDHGSALQPQSDRKKAS
jgi:hypothetical protein